MGALYKAGLVEWMSTHDLPGSVGRAGRSTMRELLTQYGTLNAEVRSTCWPIPRSAILEIDRKVIAKPARTDRRRDRQLRACRSVAR